VRHLFIAHNSAAVAYIADRVAVMRAVRIGEHGAWADLLQQPVDGYTRALLAAVPRL
jgi:ABC-type dipeptide/oligopeptide/nickel transport system ATPase component